MGLNQNIISRFSFLPLFFFSALTCFAQTSEINRTNHWYFGEGIGLDFSSGTPVLDTLSPMSQREACAVMSDTAGNLLFYTDGDTVWNKNHVMMANGFDVGCESSSNGAAIVPSPGNDSIYYLFTVDCWENFGVHGLQYAIINVNANGGTGTILQKNIQLYSPSSEQLAVTRHCNGIDYWVVSHAYSVNKFYAHKVTSNGVDTVPTITFAGDTLPVLTPIGNAGSMCFSPNGEKLCFVSLRKGCKLFDFDFNSGQLTNMIVLTTDSQYYGCAFSPDNSKLYLSFTGMPLLGRYITQFDLSSNDSLLIASSENTIFYASYAHPVLMGLQTSLLGYITNAFYYRDSIGVILNPNAYGITCNYQTFPLTFKGRLCKEQFPNINTNYYNSNAYICSNGIYETGSSVIKYFPNPVTDKLTLSNLKGNYLHLKVYTVDGRYVLFKRIDFKDETEIDTKQFPTGIYLIQLIQNYNSKIKSIKFIKSNN
jgi:hypothetical protein